MVDCLHRQALACTLQYCVAALIMRKYKLFRWKSNCIGRTCLVNYLKETQTNIHLTNLTPSVANKTFSLNSPTVFDFGVHHFNVMVSMYKPSLDEITNPSL